jgi:hypothetical protein
MVSKSSSSGGNRPSNINKPNINNQIKKEAKNENKQQRYQEQQLDILLDPEQKLDMEQINQLDKQVVQPEPEYKSPEYKKVEKELVELKKNFNPSDSYESKYTQGTTMYDNRGKYFDPYEFNKKFDDYIEKQSKIRLLEDKLRLNDLNTIENIKVAPYQLPFNKMLIGLKDTWYNFYDAIINKRNPFENFSNDDIFYFSITLILIALIYVLLSFIFE